MTWFSLNYLGSKTGLIMEISDSGALLQCTNTSFESGFAMFLQKNIQGKPFHLQHGNILLL